MRDLGFEVVEKHDLAFSALVSELKSFGDRAPQYDWALVYYAGHGIEVGGVNYVIPVDAELANFVAQGAKVLAHTPGSFAYFETGGPGGVIFELLPKRE